MTRTIEIKVPDIGDFQDVPVIEVLVSVGDHVDAEDSLVTLESDKATMEVPSPQAGVIQDMRLKVNDTVSEGDVVAVLDISSEAGEPVEETPPQQEDAGVEHGAPPHQLQDQQQDQQQDHQQDRQQDQHEPQQSDDSARKREDEPPQPDQGQARKPSDSTSARDADALSAPARARAHGADAVDPSSVPYASPSVRKFARELGADLKHVKGTGNGGRILKEDVSGYIKSVLTGSAAGPDSFAGFNLPPPPKVDFSRFGEVTEQPLTRIQKKSAGFLHRNWVSIPHVTQHEEADVTDMEAFRKANAADAEQQGFKLTPLVFLIKASVTALRKFPQFNASLDPSGENLILKSYFNIGIAVDTPQGLVVPVLRDCDRKGIMQLARELSEVSARAREQKLTPDDIQGGCFSISSLGGIGGTAFTPIINAPEVAILGVSRSRMRPIWDGKAFQPKLMLPLSMSYDHRVIDGAAAARFTRYLASQLEDLRRLTL